MNSDKNFIIINKNFKDLKWFNPLNSEVKFYGFNWLEEDKTYNRLPLKQEEEIKKVSVNAWNLGKLTSGGQVHFVTNSSKLVIHAKVNNVAMLSGMTLVGQAGFDCYVGTNYDDLLFYNTARFEIGKTEYEFTLFENQPVKDKLVVINFPLYASVEIVYFGIDEDKYIKMPKEDLSKNHKIVIYGTSITQGGCASRPGLLYTNILSRHLKGEFINFGFSGNAFGENVFAKIMAEINDVTMFIIDYEANGGTNGKLALTLEDFINTIREKHPLTPIVIVSRIKYLFDDLNEEQNKKREQIRLFQANVVKKYQKLNDDHIYYINGQKLLGKKYDEYTIDSIHPNDLGFMKIAESLEKELKKIINKEKTQ